MKILNFLSEHINKEYVPERWAQLLEICLIDADGWTRESIKQRCDLATFIKNVQQCTIAPADCRIFELKAQSFAQALGDKPLMECATVFKGNWDQCDQYAKKEFGCTFRASSSLLFGGYWYNKDTETVLYPM